MTPPDDFPGDMHWFPLDDGDADVTFGASSGFGPVPGELRDVVDLVAAARRPGSADELVGEDVIVAQIAAAVGEHISSPPGDAHERIPVLSKFRTAKLAAATTAMLVLGATAAAAATGTLPTPSHHQPSHHAVGLVAPSVAPTIPAKVQAIARHHAAKRHAAGHHSHGAFGVVASVNGVTDPNTCGLAAGMGSFTLTAHDSTIFVVNVDTTTTYADKGVTDPSFANVCVGARVAAKGTVVDTTVTATEVFIAPTMDHGSDHEKHHHGVFGTVASVNGVSDPNTCGTAGAAGTFTITGWKGTTFTVTVDSMTKFFAPGVTDPSFADICVGAKVGAKGDTTGTTVAATMAFVLPQHGSDMHGDGGNSEPSSMHRSKTTATDPQPHTLAGGGFGGGQNKGHDHGGHHHRNG